MQIIRLLKQLNISNYVVDFVREKFFLRFLRTFDNENVCWKIVFFRVNKETSEQDSGQVVDIR